MFLKALNRASIIGTRQHLDRCQISSKWILCSISIMILECKMDWSEIDLLILV